MKHVAFFLFVLGAFTTVCNAQIRINEILADPASDWTGDASLSSKDDEWVEVINVGAAAVDLSAYRLADAAGGTDPWRYGFSGSLAPGATLVVYGADAVAWQAANGVTNAGLSLNNSGDTVALYDLSAGAPAMIDSYTYASFETTDDRSVGRVPDGTGSWWLFDALNPYAGATPPLGTGCDPSPGAPNSCATALPVHESTWGAIKATFED